VPNATVRIRQPETDAISTTITGASGRYRFPFLKPAEYEITVELGLLSATPTRIELLVGQEASVNLTLGVKTVSQTVDVVTNSLLQAENSNDVTTYSNQYVENTPINGGDTTNIAFTTPGARINVGGGNTNFNVNGLPFSSVTYTVNGADTVQPYNLNDQSGSSNNTQGANDIAEAAVILNAYSAQYGREAGGQVNFVTKSGGDRYHGNLVENYNSQILNANDYFNNLHGTPRGRATANQYAASIGGPVYVPHFVNAKDKVTFFLDTEGLRYALPTNAVVSLPTTAFENYVLGNVPSTSLPIYQDLFNLYNGAPGLSRAVPVGGTQYPDANLGCGTKGFSTTPVTGSVNTYFGKLPTGNTTGTVIPCAQAYQSTVSSVNTEYYVAGRVDWNINTKQKLYFRISRDAGTQAGSTSPINPLFNNTSPQPWVIPQLNHTYTITPNLVNNFILNGSWYSIISGPADFAAAQTALPVGFSISEGGASNGGLQSLGASVPNGRLGQQLGIVDDVSWEKGKHTLQFGINDRENRISVTSNKSGSIIGTYAFGDLQDFANGIVTDTKNSSPNSFSQAFPVLSNVHIRIESLDFYAQDEWHVLKNLNLTFGARFEYQGNPWCKESCYSRANTVFLGPGYSAGSAVPYNTTLQTDIPKLFNQLEGIIPEPRFGFAYSPYGPGKTVIRGGAGLFANIFAAQIAASVFGNPPYKFTPKVTTGTVGLSPTAGTSQTNAVASDNAFQSGFSSGYTLAQFQAALAANGATFSTPSLYVNPNKFHTIKVLEWSLEVEQPVTRNDVVSAKYSGTHGYNESLSNTGANGASTSGFGGLPTVAPDPRFAVVTQVFDAGYSWYNGLTLVERHAFAHGFQGQLSYTWSKALALGTVYNPTLYSPVLTPIGNKTDAYGPTSFDTRHNLSADLYYATPKLKNSLIDRVVGNWKLGSKVYLYSGRPFTVSNSGVSSAHGISSTYFSGTILADTIVPGVNGIHCGKSAVTTPCLTTADFATAAAQTDWGNTKPNSFRGPGFFSVSSQLSKVFPVKEQAHFELGADAYNLFNHVNFAVPGSNANTGSSLGYITSDVSVPTSIYGTSQGAIVSGRVLVVFGKFVF